MQPARQLLGLALLLACLVPLPAGAQQLQEPSAASHSSSSSSRDAVRAAAAGGSGRMPAGSAAGATSSLGSALPTATQAAASALTAPPAATGVASRAQLVNTAPAASTATATAQATVTAAAGPMLRSLSPPPPLRLTFTAPSKAPGAASATTPAAGKRGAVKSTPAPAPPPPAPAASGRGARAGQPGTAEVAANSSSSSSSTAPEAAGRGVCGKASGVPWGLAAIGAGPSSRLPPRVDRVLVCLVTSGVAAGSPFLAGTPLSGCAKEDPVDPGGCSSRWDTPPPLASGGLEARGTALAALIAAGGGVDARVRGVIPGGVALHVVPVSLDNGALEPSSNVRGSTSRLRPYTVCEGRLRGLQAQDYGATPPGSASWRMVMLVDVAAPSPSTPGGSDHFQLREAGWLAEATGGGDVLVVAPAGDDPQQASVAYPGYVPEVLAVGAYGCSGAALHSYHGPRGKPDLLAPGEALGVPALDDAANASSTAVRPDWRGSHGAAAYVAGGAARLWGAFPGCSGKQIRQALLLRPASALRQPGKLDLRAAYDYLTRTKCSAGGSTSSASNSRR